MSKYTSFHFSPLNNRSMLMPKIPKGEKYVHPLRGGIRPSYDPFPEDKLNPVSPYFQSNLGLTVKTFDFGSGERRYGIYVPQGMITKSACAMVFPESGVTAEQFMESENWKELSEKYHCAYFILESEKWDKEDLDKDFDFAIGVVNREFGQRLTVDVNESFIYPIGLGDGAYVATAFALTYSATFPAFAADGDCGVDPELFDVLRSLPSDGVDTLPKTAVPMAGFIVDRSGKGDAAKDYLKEIINAKEENLTNDFGKVYLEQERPGAYYVNQQVICQAWLCCDKSTAGKTREEINEAMMSFVLRYARWGGFKNNHLRTRKSLEETGVKRVNLEVQGLPRFFDIFVPSCYREGDGKVYPMVLATHGMSCNAEYFEQTSDWHRLAEERGFIVVFSSAYPHNDGLARIPVPHWALNGMVNGEKVIDEMPYFRELIKYMEDNYQLDKKRLYAVGHSNGSMLTQVLAREMPEKFAAFGPAGALGTIVDGEFVPVKHNLKTPIYFIMGEYDLFDPTVEVGSVAYKTLEGFGKSSGVVMDIDNWYDNGNYHTLVLYDKDRVPMERYTIMMNCPHTYTAEMAQLTWDTFLCHFTREEDGSVKYHG